MMMFALIFLSCVVYFYVVSAKYSVPRLVRSSIVTMSVAFVVGFTSTTFNAISGVELLTAIQLAAFPESTLYTAHCGGVVVFLVVKLGIACLGAGIVWYGQVIDVYDPITGRHHESLIIDEIPRVLFATGWALAFVSSVGAGVHVVQIILCVIA